jgi:hypothetical protein
MKLPLSIKVMLLLFIFYLFYIMGAALLNDICDCAREYNFWWKFEEQEDG